MATSEMGARLLDMLLQITSRVQDSGKRQEAVYGFLKKQPLENAVDVLRTVVDQSLEDEAANGVFTALINVPAWIKAGGKTRYHELKRSLSTSRLMEQLFAELDALSDLPPESIMIRKARFNIWLQISLLLDFRLAETGYPMLNRSLTEMLENACRCDKDDTDEFVITIQKGDFPSSAWNLLQDILEEADFIGSEEELFEYHLSEETVERLAAGESISANKGNETVSSRISDTMLARQAENFVKRIMLAIRGATMYPADHPGLPPLLSSCIQVIQNLLSGKDLVVLTHMGGELLVDEIRIRKQNKFLKQFCEDMEARNITSITFSRGITSKELKMLLDVFVQGVSWLNDQGGARRYLSSQGVVHIALDIYRYGIITARGAALEHSADAGMGTGSSEGAVDTDTPVMPAHRPPQPVTGIAGPAEALEDAPRSPTGINTELLLLNEIAAKVGSGENLNTISTEEIGNLFKRILGGAARDDDQMKKSLAELIVSLDPEFLEKTLMENPEIRERMSWSVSRKILESSLDDLKSQDVTTRMGALELVMQIGELAILRSKFSSVGQVLKELTHRLLDRETDEDMMFQTADVLVVLVRRLLQTSNMKLVNAMLKIFRDSMTALVAEEKTSEKRLPRRLVLERFFVRVSDPETIRNLVNELGSRNRSASERALEAMQLLKTEEVVMQLLGVFEGGSRRIRSRAYQALVEMKDVAGACMAWRLEELSEKNAFPRQAENDALLVDEAFYQARNALGILAEVWHPDADRIFNMAARDSDPRIRKEVITVLKHAGRQLNGAIAQELLRDPEEDVRSLAVVALRSLEGEAAVYDLIKMFETEPRLRANVLDTLSSLSSRRAREFLLESIRLKNKTVRRIYLEDHLMHQKAILSLGRNPTRQDHEELNRFLKRLKNPLMYLFHYPLSWVFHSREMAATVLETISHVSDYLSDMQEEERFVSR